MRRINILDLHRMINERKDKQNYCYEKLLEMTHNKIKRTASQKSVRCVFEVPSYVFGYPLFDLNECIDFIVKELKANGFVVNYYFPNSIYISWDFEEIDEMKRLEKGLPPPLMSANAKAANRSIGSGVIKDFKSKTYEMPHPISTMSSTGALVGSGGGGLVKYKPSGKLELNLI